MSQNYFKFDLSHTNFLHILLKKYYCTLQETWHFSVVSGKASENNIIFGGQKYVTKISNINFGGKKYRKK
jgi:hypothetical protein